MIRILALLAPLWLLSATPADALLCHALLGCSCTVTTPDIKFDDLVPLGGATHDTQGTVNVDCTGILDVAPSMLVRIDKGTWGTIPARKMRSPAGDLLNYSLYTTNSYGTVWGDGVTGAIVSITGGLLVSGHWTVSRTIFARVAPTTNQPPGTYTDTLVVRIDW